RLQREHMATGVEVGEDRRLIDPGRDLDVVVREHAEVLVAAPGLVQSPADLVLRGQLRGAGTGQPIGDPGDELLDIERAKPEARLRPEPARPLVRSVTT